MDLPLNILNLQLDEGPQQEAPQPKVVHIKLPTLRIITEKRRGKQATIIYSEPSLTDHQAEQIATDLRHHLAVGGSSRDGEILLQGDIKKRATQYLQQLGYKIKA